MSVAERIRHELREIGLVSLYFLASFLLFLSLKALLLQQYQIRTPVLSTAVVAALVVAKVVVVLRRTPLGRRFRTSRRIVDVLWRTLVYTAMVFVVTAVERLLELAHELGALAPALARLWAGRDVDHFLAMNLAVGFSLLIYNIFADLSETMGEGGLRAFFFGPRDRAAPRPSREVAA